MLTNKDLQVFESTARGNPQLVEYLRALLAQKQDLLVTLVDEAQLRRTQGYAHCLRDLIANFDQALVPSRQRAGSST